MIFQRSYPNGAQMPNTGLFFVFHQGNVVVRLEAGTLTLASPASLSLPTQHPLLHVGNLGDSACLALELDADSTLPAGHRALTLRDLYGRLDEHQYGVAGYASQLINWQRNSRFCMRCGRPLRPMTNEWGKRCADSNCGWSMYPPVNPCTITLVHDGERVLLTHKDGWGPRYGLIAGFVEPGESLEDNLRREVAEETGVRVHAIEYFKSQPWPFPHQLMLGFLATYSSGNVVIDAQELDDARWFHIDELPHIPPPLSIARQIINAWGARLGRDLTTLPVR
jgi:NAD+ diphosphatase